jgi:hypothetical protein
MHKYAVFLTLPETISGMESRHKISLYKTVDYDVPRQKIRGFRDSGRGGCLLEQ